MAFFSPSLGPAGISRLCVSSLFPASQGSTTMARMLARFTVLLRRDTRKLLLAWLSRFGVLY
jgi:hypothetical protein